MIRGIYKPGVSAAILLGLTLELLCGGACLAYGQNALPPTVQADLLRQKIITAVKRNDLRTVVSATERYKKLGVAMPPVFLLVEAKAEHRLGDSVKAFATLQAYLIAATRNSKEYHEAINLYSSYQRAAKKSAAAQSKAMATRSFALAESEYQSGHYLHALKALQGAIQGSPAGWSERLRATDLLPAYQAAAKKTLNAQAQQQINEWEAGTKIELKKYDQCMKEQPRGWFPPTCGGDRAELSCAEDALRDAESKDPNLQDRVNLSQQVGISRDKAEVSKACSANGS